MGVFPFLLKNRVPLFLAGTPTQKPNGNNGLSKYFRQTFGMDRIERPQDNSDAFYSLFDLTQSVGASLFQIIGTISVFVALCCLVLYIAQYMMARGPRQVDESKQKITRVLISIFLISITVAIIMFIFDAFRSSSNWA